jgi:hypothetical protein
MAQTRKHKRKLGRLSKISRKHRHNYKMFVRAKGIKAFSRSPIPPSPIPPPKAPSPLIPLQYLPIPPPPNPLEARPTRRKKRWPRRVSFVENLKK